MPGAENKAELRRRWKRGRGHRQTPQMERQTRENKKDQVISQISSPYKIFEENACVSDPNP
jgi:U3 small nucleolar ribonucleoprotein component